ncbi:MAG: hypothetical protein E7010_05865 [Alphaproteobacteria bacterium]|nr:hypothetical protein [Alphaproteobacteria bacterium]
MIDPVAVPKECSCGLTQDGGCYKDNHSCVYECPSGYQFASSDPCSYGYSDRMEATCSTCGDTWSKRCYKCYATGGGSKCPEKICNIVGGTIYEDGTCSNSKCRRYATTFDCDCSCKDFGGEWIDTNYGYFCTYDLSNVACGCEL